jgi:hypothetical protein
LYVEKLHNFYSSPSRITMIKSRVRRWTGHVVLMERKGNACMVLVGKPEGKKPLVKPRRKSHDNIKTDLRGIEWCGME